MKLCFEVKVEGEMRFAGRVDVLDVLDSDEKCMDVL